MVIEQKLCSTEYLEPERDQKDEIGRIAGMDQVEAVLLVNSSRQSPLVPEGYAVLSQVTRRGTYLGRQGMAVNVNTVDLFVEQIVLAVGGTDDRDMVPVRAQGRGFHPHAAVERHREVLDDYEDARFFFTSRILHTLGDPEALKTGRQDQ